MKLDDENRTEALAPAAAAGMAGKRNKQAASAPCISTTSGPSACSSQARKVEVRPAACSLAKPSGAGMWWGVDGSSSGGGGIASSSIDSRGGSSYCSLGEEAWGLPPDQSAAAACNLPGVLDSEMLAAGMWAPHFEVSTLDAAAVPPGRGLLGWQGGTQKFGAERIWEQTIQIKNSFGCSCRPGVVG